MSDVSTITAKLVNTLKTIQRFNGWHTNIGARVFPDGRSQTDVNAPCVVLRPGNEIRAPFASPGQSVQVEYTVTGFQEYNDGSILEYENIDRMIEDLRRAVEHVCALNGAAESVLYLGGAREFHTSGSSLCSATLRYAITTPRKPLDLSGAGA